MSITVQATTEASTRNSKEGQKATFKIQNKIVNFMEETGGYKQKREEFVRLNKEYRAL